MEPTDIRRSISDTEEAIKILERNLHNLYKAYKLINPVNLTRAPKCWRFDEDLVPDPELDYTGPSPIEFLHDGIWPKLSGSQKEKYKNLILQIRTECREGDLIILGKVSCHYIFNALHGGNYAYRLLKMSRATEGYYLPSYALKLLQKLQLETLNSIQEIWGPDIIGIHLAKGDFHFRPTEKADSIFLLKDYPLEAKKQ